VGADLHLKRTTVVFVSKEELTFLRTSRCFRRSLSAVGVLLGSLA